MVTTAEEGRGGGSGGHLNGKYFNAEEEEAWDIASACMHLFLLLFSRGEDMANWFRKKEGEGEGISRMRLMNMGGGGGLTRIAKQALFPFSVRYEISSFFAAGFFVGGNERVSESTN